ALDQAREARLFVLDKMLAVLPQPRTEMSHYAPRITTILINPDKIRDIIGKGGSMIRKITEETGAQIDVEDDGRVFSAAVDQEGSEERTARGLASEEKISQEAMAVALSSPPAPPREGGFGGRDRGGRNGGGRGRGPRRD